MTDTTLTRFQHLKSESWEFLPYHIFSQQVWLAFTFVNCSKILILGALYKIITQHRDVVYYNDISAVVVGKRSTECGRLSFSPFSLTFLITKSSFVSLLYLCVYIIDFMDCNQSVGSYCWSWMHLEGSIGCWSCFLQMLVLIAQLLLLCYCTY